MTVSSATIITPCRNAEALIGATASSIMAQTAVASGRLRLQYLVCDGASTDRTVEVVREVCGDRAEIISESDRGMYDALAKGLRRATGDIVAYLNAGDFYHPAALDTVADVFDHASVPWLTGMYYVCNERGQPVHCMFPHRFRRRLIRQGVYGCFLPAFIQQETTFWARNLLATVDLDRLARCRLAGDYFLWKCFATQAELSVVATFLGAFVRHVGQQSEDKRGYRDEMGTLREPFRPWDLALACADAAVWVLAPPRVKKWLNPDSFFRWDDVQRRWC